MHPSTGSKNQTGPLFFSISLLCFSPCQAEQSRHRHLQFPSPRFAQEGRSGCPGYSGPCGELQGPTANHISTVSHCSTSCRFCPAALQLRMRDVKNHCLVPAPLQASSSACPGLELLSHLSLAIRTRCTLPALLALPAAQFCRVVFLGTFGLKMTRFLSFGRSLLAKVEI